MFQRDTWGVLQLQGTRSSEWYLSVSSRVTEKGNSLSYPVLGRWEILILLAEHYQCETEPFRNAAVTTPVLKFLITCLCSQCFCVKDTHKETEKDAEESWVAWIHLILSVCHPQTQTNSQRQKASPPDTKSEHGGLWQWLTEEDMCSPRWLKLQN